MWLSQSEVVLLLNADNHNDVQDLTLSRTNPSFNLSAVKVFLKTTVGKGEIARNEQFFSFPTVFSTLLENFRSFLSN